MAGIESICTRREIVRLTAKASSLPLASDDDS